MSGIAHFGGAVAALALASLYLTSGRWTRLASLAVLGLGCATLALWLAPSGHHRVFAAAGAMGLVAAVLLAWLFRRVPWTLPVAILACAPARIPVSVGHTTANLLLPLYLVVVAAAIALVWDLATGEPRRRELGPLTWPLALLVAWTGVTFLWTLDRKQGAIYLLFFVLPFGLLALALARLPWNVGWVKVLYVQLTAMVVVFALIGDWQYWTRTIYWNPKVKVDNVYAPSSWFYRVNSVFYDPSIYGRFLVVGIVASLVLVLFGRPRLALVAAAAATVTWLGLLPSFSQSSFIALGVAIVVALVVLWRDRALIPLSIALLLVVAIGVGTPQVRHRILGKAGLSQATGGRSKLVSNGFKLAVHHPLIGVGAGGFKRGYANLTGLKGKDPKAAASHDTPITVAAETGIPGLALFLWLLVVGLSLPFRRNPVSSATGRARLAFGLALIAIVVHSLFYNALLEDPLFWALLGLTALAARQREPRPVVAQRRPRQPSPVLQPEPEPEPS
jgi:O-antigen ligase